MRIRPARLLVAGVLGARAGASVGLQPVGTFSEPVRVPYLVPFGEDGPGRVHAVSLDGRVWRLAER